jgi:hypothetical protein
VAHSLAVNGAPEEIDGLGGDKTTESFYVNRVICLSNSAVSYVEVGRSPQLDLR